ncbi:MAG: hypothetical protein QW334_01645 [Thermofilum sp.]
MYHVYVAAVSLAAADHLSPNDVVMELRALLDDLQCDNIKPLELLAVSKFKFNVAVVSEGEIKAEGTT